MSGAILNEVAKLNVDEICVRCGVTVETVQAYVAEGFIDASGEAVSDWRFSEIAVVHIQKAYRMERDLRLNPAGVALAFELLEKIENLQSQLRKHEVL